MGIFANMFGGAQMAKASKKAAAAQTAAMQQGIGQQNQTLDTIGGYYQPYQEFGNTALGQYGDLLGIHGGDPQQAAITALQNSPYFKMLYGQGQEAVLQNASATGGISGGNTNHSTYYQCHGFVHFTCPTYSNKNKASAHDRGNGHARNSISKQYAYHGEKYFCNYNERLAHGIELENQYQKDKPDSNYK